MTTVKNNSPKESPEVPVVPAEGDGQEEDRAERVDNFRKDLKEIIKKHQIGIRPVIERHGIGNELVDLKETKENATS